MSGTISLPTVADLKQQAKRLRHQFAEQNNAISHSKSLELLARQLGYRDWNTLHAAAGNRAPVTYSVGQPVQGVYLGQPFKGEIIGVKVLGSSDRHRVTIQFDAPVDVVRFDSFSSFRRRVSCILNPDGRTSEKTSDGKPQMALSR